MVDTIANASHTSLLFQPLRIGERTLSEPVLPGPPIIDNGAHVTETFTEVNEEFAQ